MAASNAAGETVDHVWQHASGRLSNELAVFGARNTVSLQDDPAPGIGAARKWIFAEMKS